MAHGVWTTVLSAILAVAALGAPATAQEARRAAAASTETAARAVLPDGDEGMRAVAARVYRRSEDLSRRTAFQLDGARRDGDRRRAACLDGVLSQSNAVLRMVSERSGMLSGALAAGDPAVARHAVSVLLTLEERVSDLGRDMRICNGERATGPTGTTVIVTVDRDVPREDPTVLPLRWVRPDPTMPPPPPGR